MVNVPVNKGFIVTVQFDIELFVNIKVQPDELVEVIPRTPFDNNKAVTGRLDLFASINNIFIDLLTVQIVKIDQKLTGIMMIPTY